MTELATINDTPRALHVTEPAPIFSMIERIMTDPNVSVERVNQAFEFYEKVEANTARKAFDAAVAEAKREIPVIKKNRTGHNSKRYADFAAYASVIDPILSRHGLQYRFRTDQSDRISVTCILSHRLGHSEENTLAGPADTSGNKNPIQAIGSTVAYLQRYTLVQALGLAASEDDDGKAAGASADELATISEDQQKELSALLAETNTDLRKFLEYAKAEALWDILMKDFDKLKKILIAKREKR